MIEIYGQLNECIETDLLMPPYPSIFYQIPMQGEVTIDETFESPVTGSFNFVTTIDYEKEVRTRLCAGTFLMMFGFGFRVAGSPQIEEIKATEQPDRMIAVSISLDTCHLWVNEPVPLVLDRFDYGLSNSKCESPAGGVAANNPMRAERLSLHDIAYRAGGSYSGPYCFKEIPNDVNREESTTFDAELQPWLRVLRGFVRYSNPLAVEVVNWYATPQWEIRESEVISNVKTTYKGVVWQNWTDEQTKWNQDICGEFSLPKNKFSWPVPPLRDEDQLTIPYGYHLYPKSRVEFQDPTKVVKEKNSQIRAEWRLRQRVVNVEIQGDENAHLIPDITLMKDLSIQDGSYAKTKITRTTIDGMPVKEERETWDFYGVLGYQLFDLDGNFIGAAPQWAIKEKATKIYLYDSDGYELGWTEIGYRMGRFKEESPSQPETAALIADDIENAKTIDLYKWFPIPILNQKGNLIEPHFIYYADERFNTNPQYLPPWEIIEVCLPSGESRYISIENRGWIEPRFILASATYTNNFTFIQNPSYDPDSAEDPQALFLTTGEEGYTKEQVTINVSKNTQNSVRTSANLTEVLKGIEKEDSFTTYQESANAQGPENFKTAKRQVEQTTSEGRPQTAPHLPPLWERIEPEPDNGADASLASPIEWEYFVETAHLPPSGTKKWPHLAGGTKTYEKARSWSEAMSAIQAEADIEESKSAIDMSLTVLSPCLNWRAGDRCLVTINGIRRQRRILSISRQFVINGLSILNHQSNTSVLTIKSGGSDLQLGIDRPVGLIFGQQRKPTTRPVNPLERLFIRDGSTRGALPIPQTRSRLNF